MAKGLRSKVKRANRAELRKKLSIPIQVARQEMIAKKLNESLKQQKAAAQSSLQDLLSCLKPRSVQNDTPGVYEGTPAN